MRYALLFFGFLACTHPAPQPTPPTPPDLSLQIATLNVHRFFDLSCDSGRCEERDYEELPSLEAFSQRAEEISAAIERLSAEVVLLQEIESQACLDAINQRLHYPIAVIGETHTPASLDVAILAKGESAQIKTHRQEPLLLPDGKSTTFARELLELRFLFQGRPVIVFAAHFRSKVKDDAERRLAEASAAKQIVEAAAQENPNALVVLGGDLNDTPGSPTLQVLEDALLRVNQKTTGTFLYKGEPLALDHLLLAKTKGGEYIEGSAQVVRDGAGFGGSDHAALLARFRLY